MNKNENKKINEPKKLIEEINKLLNESKNCDNKESILKKANSIAEELVSITKVTYDEMCDTYTDLRGAEPNELNKEMWNVLLEYVKKYINTNISNVKLLDVGTGSGRDIIYASKIGYDVIGVDNSDGFIEHLNHLAIEGIIPKNSYKKSDMRKLLFEDETFDVVRHNASILHMPIIGKGYMADLAISEAYRVLKPGGFIYLYVKKGDSLEFVDTNESLGGRVFQFYNYEMISALLERNGFKVIFNTEQEENRNGNIIKWIAVIAKK